MPDARSHRGPDPHDPDDFSPAARPALVAAVVDLSWLLGKGYATPSALKLVGDRHSLTRRQRMAVFRSACPDDALAVRVCHRVEPEDVGGQRVAVDGFNVLTTVEAALGGAAVLLGRDGSLRDVAGVHGSYRGVAETATAVRLVGEVMATLSAAGATWWLDRPVSNSGRLGASLVQAAAERGWDWRVELAFNPDLALSTSPDVVATADSVILDRCARWLDLARHVVQSRVPGANLIDLRGPPP